MTTSAAPPPRLPAAGPDAPATTDHVRLLLTGDDDADAAAACWADRVAARTGAVVTGARGDADAGPGRSTDPADLLVVGLPPVHGAHHVDVAAATALRRGVPVAVVPWFVVPELTDVPAVRQRPVTVALPEGDAAADRVLAFATRWAHRAGTGVAVVRVGYHGDTDLLVADEPSPWVTARQEQEQRRLDRAITVVRDLDPTVAVSGTLHAEDAVAWFAGCEHLASVLVVGLDGARHGGLGRWAADHAVVPTVLVPVPPTP